MFWLSTFCSLQHSVSIHESILQICSWEVSCLSLNLDDSDLLSDFTRILPSTLAFIITLINQDPKTANSASQICHRHFVWALFQHHKDGLLEGFYRLCISRFLLAHISCRKTWLHTHHFDFEGFSLCSANQNDIYLRIISFQIHEVISFWFITNDVKSRKCLAKECDLLVKGPDVSSEVDNSQWPSFLSLFSLSICLCSCST